MVTSDSPILRGTKGSDGNWPVSARADVNTQKEDASGYAPLHPVAVFGLVKFMQVLLDHDANPHARNNRNQAAPKADSYD